VLRRDQLPDDAIAVLGDTGPARIDRLVHDLVEHSDLAGDIVQGAEVGDAMAVLRAFMFEEVYLSDSARREHEKAEGVVATLFHHFADHPELLPDGGGAPGAALAQRVTDYVAGMTDRYAVRSFAELRVPRAFTP
jgi:dGTPase